VTSAQVIPPRVLEPDDATANPAPRPLDGIAPLAGVSSAVITAATRRVARRWRAEAGARGPVAPGDEEVMAGLLAALALAVDQRRPGYVTQLVPRPAPGLGQQLVEMLQTELLCVWKASSPTTSPTIILDTLSTLDQVRQALAHDALQGLEVQFGGPQGLELLVEVVHDLRSPLTSILFLAETLQRGQSGDVNEVQRRQLGLIYSAALGLSSLVADAIELARGGDELAEEAPSPFSLTEVMESVRAIVRPMAEEKGLEIRLGLPAVDHRVGLPVPLSRVLLNLTTNALKFTEHGWVEISVEQKAGARATVAVRDTGPGINAEALASLFQPFRHARDRAGYCFSGTGLGLAITRKVVEAMGSTLRLETRPDWGTRFHFDIDLPHHRPSDPTAPAPSPHAA
jgi:signal transduction histidine kinase